MDQKERKKPLGLLLINSGVFYVKRTKKIKNGVRGDLARWKNGLSSVIHVVLITSFF